MYMNICISKIYTLVDHVIFTKSAIYRYIYTVCSQQQDISQNKPEHQKILPCPSCRHLIDSLNLNDWDIFCRHWPITPHKLYSKNPPNSWIPPSWNSSIVFFCWMLEHENRGKPQFSMFFIRKPSFIFVLTWSICSRNQVQHHGGSNLVKFVSHRAYGMPALGGGATAGWTFNENKVDIFMLYMIGLEFIWS